VVPTTTVPGFLDEGPETGRRDFNWQARAGGLTVTLRRVIVGTGFSRLELHVDGVHGNREISALQGLRVRDAAGRDLGPADEPARITTAASRPDPAGGVDTEVVLDRALDPNAVASVQLAGLTVARWVDEQLVGSLVDPELQRRAASEDSSWLTERASCPDCRLRVTCESCRTIRVVGSGYHRGRMTIAVEALDRVERTALNPSRRRVLATSPEGVTELESWIDGTGGAAAIAVAVDQLAAAQPGPVQVGRPMGFEVRVQAQAEQPVRGGWTIRQAGS
jgi:hypothetical protein